MAEIIQLSLGSRRDIIEVARLYCNVWAEPPWNETHWRVEDVLSKLRIDLAREGAAFCVRNGNGVMSGFTWGHVVSVSSMRAIAGNAYLDHLFTAGHKVFYLAELAVHAQRRERGFGKALTTALLSQATRLGCKRVILRTDMNARAAQAVYESFGFSNINVQDAAHPTRTYWVLDVQEYER